MGFARAQPILQATKRVLGRELDKDLAVADLDLDRLQPYGGVARVAAGLEIELVAMPRANDVAPAGEARAEALHLGRQQLLDAVEDLALADRAAGMRARVLVRHDP